MITIQNSTIHGLGVFAAKDIVAGELLIDWSNCSQMLNTQEIQALPDEERKYVSFIGGQYIFFKPPARFVNHSCNPNARGVNGRDIATRQISKGEEITVDYIAEQVPGLNLKCRCGAPICRGVLTLSAQPPSVSDNLV